MKIKTILIFAILSVSGTFLSAQGIKVEPGTCLKIDMGATVNISGGGHLYLKSNATGDASLIDQGSLTYTGGGEAKIERWLTQGKWHLISIPVNSALAGMFERDYLQRHDELTNSWADIPQMLYNLEPTKGYAVWTVDAAPTTELYSGLANTGVKNISFTKSGQGYNLIGNPYPSALDWDEVAKPLQLSGAIWLFDPTLGSNGDYRYYIAGGGGANTTTKNIPSGQGFFVRALSGAGTLTINNFCRTHGGQSFYKAESENHMLVLKATGNHITMQTAIRFIPESTPQIDRLYDVTKIISNSLDVPVVYTLCDNEKMAINSLPGVIGHETIPMFFEAGTDGLYSFSATEMESLGDDIPVFLEDISTNTIQNLRTSPNYSFSYSSGAVRLFHIHFKEVTAVDELWANNTDFQCFMSGGKLQVNFKGNLSFEGQANIAVYNTAGQLVMQNQTTQAETEFSFDGSAGLYIVQVLHSGHLTSIKVSNP